MNTGAIQSPTSDCIGVIRLSCTYSFTLGISWTAILEARSFPKRIEIWETVSDSEFQRTSNHPCGDIYECLLRVLESHDAVYCLFPKALSQIVVEGVSGYKAELLALCWCRWGEEKEINYCRDFTSLSKSAIEKLKYYYCSLVIESSQEKCFLKDFEDFTTLREELHCEEVPLGKIITETDLATGEGLHPTLKRLQTKWDEVSDDASPISRMIDQQVEIISRDLTQPTSFNSGMSFNRNKEQLRKFIRTFYLLHHRLPIGDLNVPDIGMVAFSAPPKPDRSNFL
jgi:hypothetical protein